MSRLLIACLFIWLMHPALAKDNPNHWVTIPLVHRSAEQVIPILRPLLNDSVQISGTGDTLFIHASQHMIKNIRMSLRDIDVPIINYQVHIRQYRAPRRVSGGGRVKVYSTRKRDRYADEQIVRVQEGKAAWVTTGLDKQVLSDSDSLLPGLRYEPIRTGFAIIVKRQGEESVQIQIIRNRERLSPNNQSDIERNATKTTFIVPLNRWTNLSRTRQLHDQRGIVYAAGEAYLSRHDLAIKIERMPHE